MSKSSAWGRSVKVCKRLHGALRKPGEFRRDLQRATWIDRLDDDAAQDAAISALLSRRHAVNEGAPERALKLGDALLDAVRDQKLDGARARRKIQAAHRRFSRAYSAAYAKRVHCPTCGSLVRPPGRTIGFPSGRFMGPLVVYAKVLDEFLRARVAAHEAGAPLSPTKESGFMSRLESMWQQLDPAEQGEAYKHGPIAPKGRRT